MSVGRLTILVERKRTSYNFKADIASPDSWDGDHNAKHNMEDHLVLLADGHPIWEAWGQTVANMPGARHTDTIVPGDFFVKWDVPRRAFKGHVHGIVGAKDQDGQAIDENSVETIPGKNGAPTDWARWIFGHSTRKNDPAPDGEVTRYAWSAGCFIVSPAAQDELFRLGTMAGLKTGDKIPCKLIEVS